MFSFWRHSMTYLDQTSLLLTLFGYHCIESVDLTTLDQPDTYAGLCGSDGEHYMGHRLSNLRMKNPTGIQAVSDCHVYFASSAHSAVYDIDTATDTVVTLSSGIPGPQMITHAPWLNALIVTKEHGLISVSLTDGSTLDISGNPLSGSELVSADRAGFYYPIAAINVSGEAIVVSDQGNNRLVMQRIWSIGLLILSDPDR